MSIAQTDRPVTPELLRVMQDQQERNKRTDRNHALLWGGVVAGTVAMGVAIAGFKYADPTVKATAMVRAASQITTPAAASTSQFPAPKPVRTVKINAPAPAN